MNLDEIIEEFRSCNYAHFNEFYNETKKNVFFTIVAIIKDNDAVDDLMQDTYIKFLENMSKYKSKTNIKAYLSTIAHNIAINYYNREKKLVHSEEIIDYLPNDEEKPKDTGYSVEVLELLKDLDDTSKEVVILHTINDLKFKEIAKIIDKPLGTVLWIYNKAIKELRKKAGVADEK